MFDEKLSDAAARDDGWGGGVHACPSFDAAVPGCKLRVGETPMQERWPDRGDSSRRLHKSGVGIVFERHGMKHRSIQPELLDVLPQDHPDAIRAREQMLLVNAVMGNHRWIERTIRRHGQRDWDMTELGAGDGTLSLRLLRAGLCREEALHAMDLASRPRHWPAAAEWTCGNVLHHPLPETRVVIANLFLHHLTNDQLAVLGSRLSSRTRLIVAVDPARLWIHRFTGRLFSELVGLNRVHRHDMRVSIRAGFRGDELRQALDLGKEWEVQARLHPLGGYRFLAKRCELDGERAFGCP